MTVEFLKAHTGKDGKSYTAGQLVDITDANLVGELIRQGIAKQRQEQRQGGADRPAGENAEGDEGKETK
jgi:hypothetical protein